MFFTVELSAVYVVAFAHKVHCFAKLVHINEWTNNDERSQYVPKPIVRCAETVSDVSAFEFVADSVRNLVLPYYVSNAKSDRADEEEKQAVVHSLLAIIATTNYVYIVRK